jgi:anaerobic magnesium-protoporphyrin IX monomethyl ester cyclase
MTNFKITFLIPPPLDGKRVVERVFGCNYGLYPIPNIFLLTAAAVIGKENYLVSYVDAPVEKMNKNSFLSYLGNDDSSVYCLYTVNLSLNTDKIALDHIRKIKGDIPVIFVGPAPTYSPGSLLKDQNTFVIRGEFELVLPELMNYLFQGRKIETIKGISYFKDGKIYHNASQGIIENLDILPFPARYLIDKNKYFNPKFGVRPITVMLTSRGCPYRCIYCVPNSLSFARELEYKKIHSKKPPVRQRSVENIIDEFKLLAKEGYKAVNILDDLFVLGEKRTIEICNGIKDLKIKWGCLSRADHLNERVLKSMAEAGCYFIDIGVESFDPKVLEYVKKDIDIDTIKSAIRLIKANGIRVKLNVLLGASPLETKESILNNIRIIKEIDPDDVMYGICNPFPGTEFYNIAKKEGWFIYGDYTSVDVAKGAIISYPHLTNKDLERLVRYAKLKFHLHPRFFIKNAERLLHPKEFYSSVISLFRKLF